jgi:[ribosomal protein S5]-alanine N-acetyltransferase
MALLDWMTDATGPVVEGHGILLRPPRAGDYGLWSDLRDRSRDYLQPWEPAWPDDDLSRAAYRRRLGVYAREMELGHAWPFFIFDARGRELMGAITLSNVRRGVAETATLGYWIGEPVAGRGHATAAVRACTLFAFTSLKLHRIEASCLPSNIASRRVLEKAGFRNEGLAKAYLKINGRWADHLLFGLLSEDAGPGDVSPS